MAKMVTIPQKEYEELKKATEVDQELVEKLKRSFEDIKHNRLTEWKPK